LLQNISQVAGVMCTSNRPNCHQDLRLAENQLASVCMKCREKWCVVSFPAPSRELRSKVGDGQITRAMVIKRGSMRNSLRPLPFLSRSILEFLLPRGIGSSVRGCRYRRQPVKADGDSVQCQWTLMLFSTAVVPGAAQAVDSAVSRSRHDSTVPVNRTLPPSALTLILSSKKTWALSQFEI
jgi:hypothetical protein